MLELAPRLKYLEKSKEKARLRRREEGTLDTLLKSKIGVEI